MSTRNKKKRIFAAILIIGDEILSGRTQDANTSFLAKWLNERGVQLKEVRIIPDNLNTIVTSVNLLRKKYDYLFTTGGIGPTHDDITAFAISKAFKKKYEYNKEAYQILEKHYKDSYFNEARKKMAKMPRGIEKAKRFSIWILVVYLLAGFALYVYIPCYANYKDFFASYRLASYVAVLFGGIGSILIIKDLKEDSPEHYYGFGLDGMIIIQSVVSALVLNFDRFFP